MITPFQPKEGLHAQDALREPDLNNEEKNDSCTDESLGCEGDASAAIGLTPMLSA